jgi:hypothetical protein
VREQETSPGRALELERHATGDIERQDQVALHSGYVRAYEIGTHVRIPEVRKRRTVPEADERMHDRCWCTTTSICSYGKPNK